jgi:hypothetical protein
MRVMLKIFNHNISVTMNKENLYCVPFEKRLLRSSKGVSYQCERYDDRKKKDLYPRQSPNSNKTNKLPKDIQSSIKYQKGEVCEVCGREFKDMRSMKIHKTKQNHHIVEKKESLKKKTSVPKKENKKRDRSYSMSPNAKRAIKAMIR